MTGRSRAVLVIALAGLAVASRAAGADERRAPAIELGPFSAPADPDALPPGWEHLTFKRVPRHTRYTVVRDGAGHVLRAESHAAASTLFRRVDADPRAHPVLAWRWKVDGVIARADARTRAGDDYPARVYVAFRYEPERATLWERTVSASIARSTASTRPRAC